jgi:hypothetical protein
MACLAPGQGKPAPRSAPSMRGPTARRPAAEWPHSRAFRLATNTNPSACQRRLSKILVVLQGCSESLGRRHGPSGSMRREPAVMTALQAGHFDDGSIEEPEREEQQGDAGGH